MPHGVLFRGAQEKAIRRALMCGADGARGDVIEAIIGLPPKLFYGTGIPACLLVLNPSKPDARRGKILFVNADREFAEGKNQNTLRPEDIDKIVGVVSEFRDVAAYSRLVDLTEIETHDYNLNIRRYVDNTPDPEPQDVRAHLLGGVPQTEVLGMKAQCAKFGVAPDCVFVPRDERYFDFAPDLKTRDEVRRAVEDELGVRLTMGNMHGLLGDWWEEAREDFAGISIGTQNRNRDYLPTIRKQLLDSALGALEEIGVLDAFQISGIFVNWWDGIKYDLSIISTIGWNPTLVPRALVEDKFFGAERELITQTQADIGAGESELSEALESAAAVLGDEDDDEEAEKKPTASGLKADLKKQIETRHAATESCWARHSRAKRRFSSPNAARAWEQFLPRRIPQFRHRFWPPARARASFSRRFYASPF